MSYDALVVGAGPAGCAAELSLHGAGARVLTPFEAPTSTEIGACEAEPSGQELFGIDGSRFFSTEESTGQPSVSAIKQAIVDNGAVTIVVLVTTPFDDAGRDPIENTDADLTVNRGLHEVVVTGWDDEFGAWRLKNSWGTDGWGVGGMGWIVYNDPSIVGSHFSTVTPRRNWSAAARSRIMNSTVAELLSNTPSLFSSDAEVYWPASLGFPTRKMTVDDGMVFAQKAGLISAGTATRKP